MMLPSVPIAKLGTDTGDAMASELTLAGVEGEPRKLMVVDDDLNHLAVMADFFEPIGFQIFAAATANQAIAMLEDLTPDIFILDIDMPERDGWSLAEELRRGPLKSLPIIMISGHALDASTPMERDELYEDFVTKPYNLEDLATRVAEQLKINLLRRSSRDEPVTDQAAGVIKLSRQMADELRALAEIGHVRQIEQRLDVIEAREDAPAEFVAVLRRKLSTFDMEGLVRVLTSPEQPNA